MTNVNVECELSEPADLRDLTGSLEWLDRQVRKRRRRGYQDIKRDQRLEDEALRKAIECKPFKALVPPEICRLRAKMFPCRTCPACKSSVNE